MSYKKENLTERVIFRISKEEKTIIDSILSKGIYKSQSELFRGSLGVMLFFEEKISLSEITNLYLRGSVQAMFSEIKAIKNESMVKEKWKKMKKEIMEAKEERELEIKELEEYSMKKELEIKELEEYSMKKELETKNKELKFINSMKEERNITIKMMINFIDIFNKIPVGMKRRKLDFTEEGKLVKSLAVSMKKQLEKAFLFYLRDTSKMSQTEIDELFESNN